MIRNLKLAVSYYRSLERKVKVAEYRKGFENSLEIFLACPRKKFSVKIEDSTIGDGLAAF